MSNKTTFEVTGVARLDVSQVKQAAEQIKSSLQGVTLPGGIDKNLASIFQRLNSQIAEFEISSKKATTNADWSNVLKSGNKILELYRQMEGQITQITSLSKDQLSSIFPPKVKQNIDAAKRALENYDKELQDSIKTQEALLASAQKKQQKAKKGLASTSGKTAVSDAEYTARQSASNKAAKAQLVAEDEVKKATAALEEYKRAYLEAHPNGRPASTKQYKELAADLATANGHLTQTKTVAQQAATALSGVVKQSKIDSLTSDLNLANAEINEATEAITALKSGGDPAALQNLITTLQKIDGIELGDDAQDLEAIKRIVESVQTTAMQQAETVIDGVSKTYDQGATSAERFKEQVNDGTNSLHSLTSMQGQVDSLKNSFLHFFSLTNGWMLLRRGIRAAYEAVKELDDAMTEIAVVSEYTLDDIWAMRDGYTKAASDMGAKTIDLVNATKLYVQQGMDLNEAQEVGIETTKMARIANLDGAEATNLMTAALRGFNMEMNEANRVNDVYSQLAAKSAADTEEIATAMSKTASIAANAGASFENTSAFLTQIIETTREAPETAGTALKTIIARFQELKKAPSEIGEVDGEMVDANKIETALKTAGVELRNAQGEFRNFDDVIIELAGKWNNLDVMTQRYIATMAAGSRQQSRFIALMADSERLMELTGYAANSAGASNDQFNKTLDSLEAKMNKLKNAWSLYLQNLANNQIIKGAVDMLTLLLETINSITAIMPGFTGSIFQAILTFAAFKAAGALINKAFNVIGPMLFKQGQTAGAQYTAGMKSGLLSGQAGIKSVLKKIRALFAKEKWIGKGYTIKFKADSKALAPYTNAMKAVNAAQANYIKIANDTTATDAVRQQSEANLTAALASRNIALQTLGVSEAEYNTLQGLGLGQSELEVALTNQDVRAKLLEIAATKGLSDEEKKAAISQALINTQQQMGILTQAKYLIALLFGSQATRQQALNALAAAGAMGLHTAANGTATGAQWALNAAIYACPLGWILVLILAVVAALAVLAIAIENAIETDAERSERLTKAAEAAKEAANEANEAYSTLSDSLKDIQAQQVTLDTMTEETLEWKEQVVQLNKQVLELLEKIPELATAVSLVNGHLAIDTEIAAPILEEKRQDAIAANTVAQIANAKLAENEFIIKQKKLPNTEDFLSSNLVEFTTSLDEGKQLLTRYDNFSNGSKGTKDHFLYSLSSSDDEYNNKWSLTWYDKVAEKENMTYEDFKQITIDTLMARNDAANNNKFKYDQGTDENGNAIVTYDDDGSEQKWVFNEDEMKRLYKEYIPHIGDKAKLELEKEQNMQGHMNAIVAQLDNDRAGEMELAINGLLATADLYEKTKVETANYGDEYLKSALMREGLTEGEAQGELDADGSNNDSAKKRLYEEATGLEYDPEKVGDDWFKNYEQMKKIQEVQQDITDAALNNAKVAAVVKKDYNQIAKIMASGDDTVDWATMLFGDKASEYSDEAKNTIIKNAQEMAKEIAGLETKISTIFGEKEQTKVVDYNLAIAFTTTMGNVSDENLQEALKIGYQIAGSENEGITQEMRNEYQEFLNIMNSDSAIQKATAMREALDSTNLALVSAAAAYAKLGGSAFSAEAQVNELYNTLGDDVLQELQEDGKITATEMANLAKTNKTVSDVMANTGLGAAELANYYDLLSKGIISASDAGAGFLKVLNKLAANQNIIDNAFSFVDTFEADRSQTKVSSQIIDYISNFRKLYEQGAYSDPALKSYAKAIMGDNWEKIEKNDNLNDQQKAEKAYNQIAALPEEGGNLYKLWQDFANNSESNLASMGTNGEIVIDTQNIENIDQLKQALMEYGYSAEFASAMITDLQTYSADLNDIFEKMSINDGLQAFVQSGLLTEKDGQKILELSDAQLKIIAEQMGVSIGEAKKIIEEELSEQKINVNWKSIYDDNGNLSNDIIDQILEDNVIGEDDYQMLIGLGLNDEEAKKQLATLMSDTDRDFSKTRFGFNTEDTQGSTDALAQMQQNKLDYATALGLLGGMQSKQVETQQEINALESEKSTAKAMATGVSLGMSSGIVGALALLDKVTGWGWATKFSSLVKQGATIAVDSSYDAEINKLKEELKNLGSSKKNNVQTNFDQYDVTYNGSGYDSLGSRTLGTTGATTDKDKEEEEKWEEDYDWLYNQLQKQNKLLRERNKIEKEGESILRQRNLDAKSYSENLKAQEKKLKEQNALNTNLLAKRKQEMAALEEHFSGISNKYGIYFDEKTGQIHIPDNITQGKLNNTLTKEQGKEIDKFVSEMERVKKEMEKLEDDIADNTAILEKEYERRMESYKDKEADLIKALISQREKEIDQMEELNSTISDAASEMLDKIQTGIDDYRQAREDEEALSDIEDMESRLALMRSDTSGANQLDILALEKELQQARQDFMDNKIDQAIDQLSRQNELAKQQREKQIELMQWQLQQDKESGAIAGQANAMLAKIVNGGSAQAIMDLLKKDANYANMGTAEREVYDRNLKQAIEDIKLGWAKSHQVTKADTNGKTIDFVDKNGKTIKGVTVTADGTVKDAKGNTYTGIYKDPTGVYRQAKNGNITTKPKDKPTTSTTTTTTSSSKGIKITDSVKKYVSDSIWGGYWGNNPERKKRLTEVFGAKAAAEIQGLVNQGVRFYPKGSRREWSYENQKKKKYNRYETGGLADFTGPAWLDGTKARPEYVLNAEQTRGFLALVDMLGDFDDNPTAGGNNYYDVRIEVDELSNDYDVEQLMDKMKRMITDDAMYRNVNAIDLGRR